jgi:hypothetical protein
MAKFKITYTSGLTEEVDLTDANTVDECISTKFGIDAAAVAEHGTTVELVAEEAAEAVVEAEPVAAEETPAE